MQKDRSLLWAGVGLLLRAVLLVALGLAWLGLELGAARSQAAAGLALAASDVQREMADFLQRVAQATSSFYAADLGGDRIALTAHMLRLAPFLAPGSGLFLFAANGRFFAASEPLLPDSENVAHRKWFQTMASAPVAAETKELICVGPVAGPLGGGVGTIIARQLRAADGRLVGVIGTFLPKEALDRMAQPLSLPLRATARIEPAAAMAGAFAYSLTGLGSAFPPIIDDWLHWGLTLFGVDPVLSLQASLPGGLIWRARSDFLAAITPAERTQIFWHGGLLLIGAILLAFLIRGRPQYRSPARPKVMGASTLTSPRLHDFDADFVWEIDSRGFLVGVAGNAPAGMTQVIGSHFIALGGADSARDLGWIRLRAALTQQEAFDRLELSFVLGNGSKRFRLSGRPVAETGGFWGTACAIPATEPTDGAQRLAEPTSGHDLIGSTD